MHEKTHYHKEEEVLGYYTDVSFQNDELISGLVKVEVVNTSEKLKDIISKP